MSITTKLFFTLLSFLLLGIDAREENEKEPTSTPFIPFFSSKCIKSLTEDNFRESDFLAKDYTIVEFYGTWCPHCRKADTHYQIVGKAFGECDGKQNLKSNLNVVHVSCFKEIKLPVNLNNAFPICKKMGVKSYPRVRFYKTEDLLKNLYEAPFTEINIHEMHKCHDFLPQMNQDTKSLLTEKEMKQFCNEKRSMVHGLKPSKVRVTRYESVMREDLMLSNQFLELMKPLEGESTDKQLEIYQKFVKKSNQLLECPVDAECEVKLDRWKECDASVAQIRGYTCGLWQWFHVLLNKDDTENMFLFIRDYVQNIFSCRECKEHFLNSTLNHETEIALFEGSYVLYLWKVHNDVNWRLRAEEKTDEHTEDYPTYIGDPRYPKQLWPTRKQCDDCYNYPCTDWAPTQKIGSWKSDPKCIEVVNLEKRGGFQNIFDLSKVKEFLQTFFTISCCENKKDEL